MLANRRATALTQTTYLANGVAQLGSKTDQTGWRSEVPQGRKLADALRHLAGGVSGAPEGSLFALSGQALGVIIHQLGSGMPIRTRQAPTPSLSLKLHPPLRGTETTPGQGSFFLASPPVADCAVPRPAGSEFLDQASARKAAQLRHAARTPDLPEQSSRWAMAGATSIAAVGRRSSRSSPSASCSPRHLQRLPAFSGQGHALAFPDGELRSAQGPLW